MTREVAVFIFAGFLESGKTTALQGMLINKREIIDGKALIISTEDGVEEYSKEELKKLDLELLEVEDEDAFTLEYLKDIDKRYSPDTVCIEFNGIWDLKTFINRELPDDWYFATIFSFVDARTYDIYLQNMRQTLMNPLSVSDVIMFNRCEEDFHRENVRRALKILNSRAEVFFTGKDGSITNVTDEILIPEKNGILEVDSSLFCQWFVDCVENTDKYYGKRVRFTALVSRGRGLKSDQIYVGRYAAVCCAEDAQFIGFIAQKNDEEIKDGDWIEIEAVVKYGELDSNRRIILLNAREIIKIDPPEVKLLYF
ncbi:MAG: hypothetical protein K5894_07820 [Lachnospiraceae bacterium]|nr:hypothetical protein [Lachnospiraceae bacterium]